MRLTGFVYQRIPCIKFHLDQRMMLIFPLNELAQLQETSSLFTEASLLGKITTHAPRLAQIISRGNVHGSQINKEVTIL